MANEKESALDKQMEGVNNVYKATKHEESGQNGASLAREAQLQLIKSFQETSKLVAKMPEGSKKQSAMAEYRKMISESLSVMCDLKKAFLAEVAKLREQLTEMRNTAQEQFKEPE